MPNVCLHVYKCKADIKFDIIYKSKSKCVLNLTAFTIHLHAVEMQVKYYFTAYFYTDQLQKIMHSDICINVNIM